jgi:hypothetical protein
MLMLTPANDIVANGQLRTDFEDLPQAVTNE